MFPNSDIPIGASLVRVSLREVSFRDALAVGLSALGFLLLCLFHGAALNLAVFTYALLALLLALAIIGPWRIAAALGSTPRQSAFGLAWLAALALSYAFSLSKDGSFVPTLVLAVPVIGFALGGALQAHARILFGLASLIVFGFACWSAGNLLVGGDLAHFSLTDKNNYGTLLYLIAIPWIHHYLVASWRGERMSPVGHGANAVGMFIVLVALFGTSSRACLLVIAMAFVVWIGLTLRHRRSAVPVLVCAAIAATAYVVSSIAVDVSAADKFTGESVGTGMRVRAALIASALEMLDGHLLTGVGVLVFPLLYRSNRTLDDLGTTGLFVHNDYVQFLVEGGVPLLLLSLVFLVVVTRRCLKSMFADAQAPCMANLGLQLAVCAAAFHALLNFVYYTPALGFLIGLLAALSSAGATQRAPTEVGERGMLRPGPAVVVGGLGFGAACLWFLAVDTLAAGVFGGQPGVPFAAAYRSDPQRMLAFARSVQALNGNRGLPVLVEASLLARKAGSASDADPLLEQTLAAYRRAIAIDPYNGSAWLGMAQFVDSRPQLLAHLPADSAPEALVLASLEIDPLFVPGIDWLVARYSQTGRQDQAYALVRRQILPWLRFLGREDPQAAVNYFRYLEANAKRNEDAEVIDALERLRRGEG